MFHSKKKQTKPARAVNRTVQKKKAPKPYYVSYEVSGNLGKTKGRREFSTFQSAQKFAVRVNEQKSARLISWGAKKSKR